MTAVAAPSRSARLLVSPQLFDRLAERVVRDEGTGRDLAERMVDQTLAFLGTCAANPGEPLVPSPAVDIGWHVFLLHTKDYAAFCWEVAGRFIHHVPDDSPGAPEHPVGRAEARVRTLDAIERAGYAVDPELWALADGGKCTSCHEEGCSASGQDGNENTGSQNPTK